ncbi:MAG: hypothetical protein ACRC0B_07005 [Legionella sp.]
MPVEVITIDFSRNNAQQQAKQILDKAQALYQQGHEKVGITYSANQDQTETIKQTYGRGQWQTRTSGANQAAVMAAVEQLLATPEYQHLQTVFRIVPITTMEYGRRNNTALDGDVQQSLNDASQFIDDGGYLLGWANQLTNGSVAIGGGVAAQSQTSAQKEMIQQWINNTFAKPAAVNHVQPTTTPSLRVQQQSQQGLTRNDELNLFKANKKIKESTEKVLRQFAQSISGADIPELNTILDAISDAKIDFFAEMNNMATSSNSAARNSIKQACMKFTQQCQEIIHSQRHTLEPKWTDYLSMLLKKIANAVIFTVTFGQKSNFFSMPEEPSPRTVASQHCESLSAGLKTILPD